MDVSKALSDIDAALNDPPVSSSGVAAVTEMTNRLHACLCRYAPAGTTWRQEGDRYLQLHVKSDLNPGNISPDAALRGILQSLRRELEGGNLSRFEELVHANVFADLLAQADGLCRDGYHRAAAVVAGAALEEHIKKLAFKNGLSILAPNGAPKKASALNSELKSINLYSEPQRALIDGWQKIRNEAAHGNPGFDGTNTSLVSLTSPMIVGVRSFLATYPA